MHLPFYPKIKSSAGLYHKVLSYSLYAHPVTPLFIQAAGQKTPRPRAMYVSLQLTQRVTF